MFPIILEGVVGSSAYGLATEHSDVDRLGVMLAPTELVLGLDAQAAISASVVERDPNPDRSVHELGKYVNLALRSNPTVLELLYLDSYEVCTEAGAALLELRSAFPSTALVRSAYGGYAMQQATRLLARHEAGQSGFSSNVAKRTAKHARHCLRLLHMGTELLRTGELVLDVSDLREELFGAGELATRDPEAFKQLFEARLARMDEVASVLPDHPDRARADALVVELRTAQLRSH